MSATILNTDSNINAKTVMAAENAETVSGLKTFSRAPNPPFAVQAGSASVANLDADKLDGQDGTWYGADWSTVAYAAGNFTAAGGGTWTVDAGDQTTFRVRKINKTLDVQLNIDTTSVTGTVTACQVTLPFTAAVATGTSCLIFDNTGSIGSLAFAQIGAASNILIIKLASGGNLTAAVNATYIRCQITIETTT